ncbi:TonB-dependent outer membrane receptor [Aliidongia dinghuensis]|uniref:TonB-dependent outer membrane receptor n=1 Tax=Aliidongia dinghuensis TaxID=1867774 RepID=A0A8J2YZK8_9PROT|nr:STN domain-containing protein [Aliidongia dinghuensis]GGF46883.1 TonB-dependent outer membrane receptor [Aliidongia dinghuensis]
MVSAALPAVAGGQSTVPSQTQQIVYDIPAESLAAALKAYAEASGVQVLYETALTDGQRSAAVKGKLAPDIALQMLLAGSGLISRHTDVDAVAILPAPRAETAAAMPQVPPDARFLGALQAGLLDTLCRSDETRPGAYHVGVQFWIAPDGVVQRSALLGSTGEPRRDAALAGALGTIAIRALPPPGMGQPVTLIITPRSPAEGDECGGR